MWALPTHVVAAGSHGVSKDKHAIEYATQEVLQFKGA